MPLDSDQRQKLLSFSAALCIAPLILAPIAARPSFESAQEHSAPGARLEMPALPLTWTPARVHLKRDPFVNAAAASPQSPISETAKAEAVEVRAIVTGTVPRALVESTGGLRIVSAGSSLQGSIVVRIDAAGIHLKNGATLPLSEARP